MNHLGKLIVKIRLRAGLTQSQVSHSMRLTSPQFVSNIERGLNIPSPTFVAVLCRITKTKPETIALEMSKQYMTKFLAEVAKANASLPRGFK